MRRAATLLAGLLLALAATTAGAVEPDEILDDPVLEERAREISKDIRCVVCQNESIDTSNAELAKDMRVLIRERLKTGDSNAEVKAYLVERYGDYVLLTPPVRPATYLLWFGPLAVLLLGAAAVVVYFRSRQSVGRGGHAGEQAATPLTSAEEARLRALLDEDGADDSADGRAGGGRRTEKPDRPT